MNSLGNIIEVHDLHKNFSTPLTGRKFKALDGLSFQVRQGSVVGFLGANGAGKTTTLKIILRLIFADSGSVKIFGQDHKDLGLKSRLGFLTERPYFYDHLTGREFLQFCAQLFQIKNAGPRISELLGEVGLTAAGDRPMRTYSKGMLQRIGIAQALINNPELLILDEPMTGLDPDGRSEMCQIIKRSHQRGATVLFSTHLLPDVENLCDRVVMIDKGRLIAEDTVQSLLARHSEGWVIMYRKQGTHTLEEVRLKTEAEVQTKIDQLRSSHSTLEKLAPLHPSLEDVFLKMKSQSATKP